MKKATKRRIIRRTETEKLELIKSWEKSGRSIKRFCDEHQFSGSLFHGWLNKYRRNKEGHAPGKFVPVQIQTPIVSLEDHAIPYAEVILKDGNRIKFYQPVSVDCLRILIA